MVLICISLMINDEEHLLLSLLSIHFSTIFIFSAHFLIRLFGSFSFDLSSSYTLDINLLSDIWFVNIFYLCVDYLLFCWWFPLLCISFLSQCSYLFIFAFVFFTFIVKSKKLLTRWMSRNSPSMISSRMLMVSGFTFQYLIHSELIFAFSVN